MNKTKTFFLVILLKVLLSACGGTTPQPSASATPRVDVATLRATLPTTSGTSEPTTHQTSTTLSSDFDLNRTEDNPITDAQQIIDILKVLEHIQRDQAISPGWYVNLITYKFSTKIHSIYHVLDTQGYYDFYTMFSLSPDKNILGQVEKNDDTTIYIISGTYSYQMESYEGCCNLTDPNKDFYENYSEAFYNDLTNWEKPSSAQWGEWAYAGWFEEDDSGYIFVLKEEATNIRGAYSRDPDTQELRAKKMEIIYTGFSLLSGYKVWEVHNTTLMNGKEAITTYVLHRDHCIDMDCIPVDAIDFLKENQIIDNNQP